LVDGARYDDGDGRERRSKWTSIYWDITEPDGRVRPYVRLTPCFMDLGGAGYPHGLSLSGGPFETECEAVKFADSIDIFMDGMILSYVEYINDLAVNGDE